MEGRRLSRAEKKALKISIMEEEIANNVRIAALVAAHMTSYICKEPRRTSSQTGAMWVQEVLEGHDIVCHENFRLEKHVFYHLCSKLVDHGLQHTKYTRVEEMVAMFLYIVGHGLTNRIVQERFQHSGETISRLFHYVLQACLGLATEYVKPLDPEFRGCHPNISNDRRYFPYFRNAIGAIDGTHISCVVSESERDKYVGRKGYPTQNIMAVCDWDMCFTYVLAGWEGTAHDARLFNSAITTPRLNFPHPPQGKYYLVDAGYPTPVGYIGPYRRERYHLPQFRRQPGLRNPNEYFNYYHSSLRCTIERAFGVWKKRFNILRNMLPYDFQTQIHIVCVTMAIHNLIRRFSNSDVEFGRADQGDLGDDDEDEDEDEDDDDPPDEGPLSNMNTLSSPQMNHLRDKIREKLVRHSSRRS